MPPIGPPPYTHEQISAMTSQVERTRAYAELASYVARLKREKAERQNAEAQGDAGSHYSSPPHRKYGVSSHGSAYYHPYQRAQAMGKSAIDSRDADDAENLPKQLSRKAVTKQPPKKALSKPLSNNAVSNRDGHQTEPKKLCPAFTSAGHCSRNVCPNIHDPDKQALCKHWFYKNTCQMGKFCSLSHVATPHNTPTCTYFMAGRCFNNDCQFAHVRVDPTALNCEKFGTMGYCEKGNTCTKLHAHECPYFANLGYCYHGDKCRLGHCHRASRMKASRYPSPACPSMSNKPSRSNTPEVDTDAAEANLEQIVPNADAHQQAHQFTQQADFVSFNDDP